MNFDWINYLTLAEALENNPLQNILDEASYRTAASRAYYAAYHKALSLAKREGYISSHSGDDHQQVQLHFSRAKSNEKIRRSIGENLDRLRDLRHKADYRDSLNASPRSLASHANGMAKGIIDNLKSLEK
jgi:uncharacterized protein (UPF0332 family)